MMKFLIKYEKELLNLRGSKLGQTLHADKTGFHRFGHICQSCFKTSLPAWYTHFHN